MHLRSHALLERRPPAVYQTLLLRSLGLTAILAGWLHWPPFTLLSLSADNTNLPGSSIKPVKVPYSSRMGLQGFCVTIRLRSLGQVEFVVLWLWCFSHHAMPGSFLVLAWGRSIVAASIWRPCIPFLPACWLRGQQQKVTGNAVIQFGFTKQCGSLQNVVMW